MTTLRFFSAATALLVCTATATAQANDNCATASAATLGITAFDSTLATDSGFDQAGATCGFTSEVFADLWYTFTPAASGSFDFATLDGGFGTFDTKFTLYDNAVPACPPLLANIVDCDDDGGPGLQSFLRINLTGGNEYLLRLGGFNGASGAMNLSIVVTPPPPVNDDCATAIPAALGLTPFNNATAVDSGFDQAGATCGFTSEITGDVWYTFTAGATASHDIATLDGGFGAFDTKVTIYDNTVPACPPLVANIVDCDDASGPGTQSRIRTTLTAGTPYLIRVGGDFGSTGAMDLSIILTPPPPANDVCSGAIAIGLGLTAIDTDLTTTTGVALDPLVCDLDASADERIYNDLWHSFTAPSTGNFTMDTDNGTDFDTRIAVYNQSTCPDSPANVIACDDDTLGLQSEVLVDLVSGTTYLIRVGSDDPNDRGTGNLTIGVTPPPPANDECANAIVVTLGTTNFDQTNATDSLDTIAGATCGITTIFQDIWFTFTPATTAVHDFESFDAGFGNTDTKFALYSVTTCPADELNLIDCDDDGGANAFHSKVSASLTAGVPVLLRVGTFGIASTTLPTDLVITVFVPPVPPANDDCANATPITMFGTYAYDTSNATTDGLDLTGFCDPGTFGDEDIHNDVWFEYTPAVGGCTYISTLGLATYDTRLAIYTGATCPNDPATVLACNDDEVLPIAGPFEAGIDVTLSAGTTYLIRLGNFGVADVGGAASVLISAGPFADVNNTSGTPQVGAPGCAAGPLFNEFCFGDGGNQAGCTNCPCGNEAPIGSGGGCLNSGGDGIQLIPSGDTSVSLPSGDTTDLRFGADGAPPSAFCILNSGDAVAPGNMANPCFGMNSGAQAAAFDGLRCAITNTRRHGGRSADANGDIGVTNNPWGGAGGPPVGIAVAGGGFAAGQTRFFQIINRDDALAVCMRALNTSQAVEVTFTP